MDTRSSSLAVGVYVIGGLALAAIVGLALFAGGDRWRERFAGETVEAAATAEGEGSYLRRGALTRQEYLAAHNSAEVERLRQLLDEKNVALERRTALLQQRTVEYQKLKKDFDAATDVVLEFLQTPPSTPAPSVAQEGEPPPRPPAAETPVDASVLREELNKARLLESTLAAEVEELQAEVVNAEAEIARLQQEAQAQIEQLLASERELRAAAGEALVRIGEPAIPTLTEALRDERPAVRRWAAAVLADMGPVASPAVGPLMDALADRDESVRTAAAQALRAVGTRD